MGATLLLASHYAPQRGCRPLRQPSSRDLQQVPLAVQFSVSGCLRHVPEWADRRYQEPAVISGKFGGIYRHGPGVTVMAITVAAIRNAKLPTAKPVRLYDSKGL